MSIKLNVLNLPTLVKANMYATKEFCDWRICDRTNLWSTNLWSTEFLWSNEFLYRQNFCDGTNFCDWRIYDRMNLLSTEFLWLNEFVIDRIFVIDGTEIVLQVHVHLLPRKAGDFAEVRTLRTIMIYNVRGSLMCFGNNYFLLLWKNAQAYCKAGVVGFNWEVLSRSHWVTTPAL
jgi:hypothetical protein